MPLDSDHLHLESGFLVHLMYESFPLKYELETIFNMVVGPLDYWDLTLLYKGHRPFFFFFARDWCEDMMYILARLLIEHFAKSFYERY